MIAREDFDAHPGRPGSWGAGGGGDKLINMFVGPDIAPWSGSYLFGVSVPSRMAGDAYLHSPIVSICCASNLCLDPTRRHHHSLALLKSVY